MILVTFDFLLIRRFLPQFFFGILSSSIVAIISAPSFLASKNPKFLLSIQLNPISCESFLLKVFGQKVKNIFHF